MIQPDPKRTPTGLQRRATISGRRTLFHTLVATSTLAMSTAAAAAVAPGGTSLLEAVVVICVATAGGYALFEFWNAVVAATLLLTARDPTAAAAPLAPVDLSGDVGARKRTALICAARNEPVAPVLRRLTAMRRDLDRAGVGAWFDVHLLSDTVDGPAAAAEAAAFDAAAAAIAGEGRAFYRRRSQADGFKAGNVREFVDRAGEDYVFMVTLDADSIMSADAILRLTTAMESHPRLAILQSLILPTPGRTVFDHVFRFGVRTVVRSHYLGRAWWQADMGAYGGHNAVIRLQPFAVHARLPEMPGPPPLGGAVLGHDHVEAVLLRRAGFETRLWPIEIDSFEDHPPSLIDLLAREARWARGNMQFGLLAASRRFRGAQRFHLAQFFWLHIACAAATLGVLAAVAAAWRGDEIDMAWAGGVAATLWGVAGAPKAVGWLDQSMTPGRIRAFGGVGRFARAAALDAGLSVAAAAAAAIAVTGALLGLARDRWVGAELRWVSPPRGRDGATWREAMTALWPQTLLGAALGATGAAFPTALALAAVPIALALACSIPIAVWTAQPASSHRLVATPEADRAILRDLD